MSFCDVQFGGDICLKVRRTERGSDVKEKAHGHTVKPGLTLNLIC